MSGSTDDATTVQLHAGRKSTGEPVLEEVRAEHTGGDVYRVVCSPGLVLGTAAGDLIRLRSEKDGSFEVIERGNNLCIQIFRGSGFDEDEEADFRETLARIGGRLDGKSSKELVFTVPVDVGFSRVESTLDALVARYDGARWYFGNVYDPEDGVTPLNWWDR